MPDQPPRQSFYQSLINFRVGGAQVEEVFPNDWRFTVARNRAFYVRGISWFRDHVQSNIRSIDRPNERITEIISKEDRWISSSFDFSKNYAINQQLYPAFRKNPLLFEKAISTIILLYSYCRQNGHDSDVLNRFSVEPAVSYIKSFSGDLLQEIEKENQHYLHALAEATLQGTKDILYKLADGKGTVTHKLAHRIRGAIAEDFKHNERIYVGAVDIKTGRFSALSGDEGESVDADDERVRRKCQEIIEADGIKVSVPQVSNYR